MSKRIIAIFLLMALSPAACDSQREADSVPESASVPQSSSPVDSPAEGPEAAKAPTESATAAPGQAVHPPGYQTMLLPPALREWTGDLDGMIERRDIRVLTVYGLGTYYLDGGEEKGPIFEAFRLFEQQLNEKLGRDHVRVYVAIMPVARDQLIQGLIDGMGDIAVATLTITPEREAMVDFTEPITRELNEILVTGTAAPLIESLEDLSGLDISVRESSSYHDSLRALNRRFEAQGIPPVNIQFISELLEDDDVLEAAREIGRETIQYVANIFKYYLAYRLSLDFELRRGEAREEAGLD